MLQLWHEYRFKNEDPNHIIEDLGQSHIHTEKMPIIDRAAAPQDSAPNRAAKMFLYSLSQDR